MTTAIEAMRNVLARFRSPRSGRNNVSLLNDEPMTQEAMRILSNEVEGVRRGTSLSSVRVGSFNGMPVFSSDAISSDDHVIPYSEMTPDYRREWVNVLERTRDREREPTGDENPRDSREGSFRNFVSDYGVMRMGRTSDVSDITISKPLSDERKEIDRIRKMVMDGDLTGKKPTEEPTHICRDAYQCGNRSRVPRTPVCWLRSTDMQILRTDDLIEGLNDVIEDMNGAVNNDLNLRIVVSPSCLASLRMRSTMRNSTNFMSRDLIGLLYMGIQIMSNESLASNVGYVYCADRFVENDLANPDFARRVIVNRE